MTCEQFERAIVLQVYGELDGAEAHELQHHLAACAHCAAQVQSVQQTRALLNARPVEPASPALLASYRARLEARLDEEAEPSRRWADVVRAWFTPGHQMHYAFAPGLVVALVVVGFLSGWLSHSRVAGPTASPGPGPVRFTETPFEQQQTPQIFRVTSVAPTSNGLVSVTYDDIHRQSVEGLPTNPNIERLLLIAAQNPPNAGVRLDSIDALRERAGDATVRQTLLRVLQRDPNPGVRLKALDALRPSIADDAGVRTAVLRTVLSDGNPGVRAEAIDALTQAPPGDATRMLQEASRQTSNVFVRLRCAAALKQLSAPMPHPIPTREAR
jgi:hypothetical protein